MTEIFALALLGCALAWVLMPQADLWRELRKRLDIS
jgi:hypothetical protein